MVFLQSGSILFSTCQRLTHPVLSNSRCYLMDGLLHLPPRLSIVLQSDYHCHDRRNFRLCKGFVLQLSCLQSPPPGLLVDKFLSSSHSHVALPNTPLLILISVMYVTLIPHNNLSIWFANIMLKKLQFTDKKCLSIHNLLFQRKILSDTDHVVRINTYI